MTRATPATPRTAAGRALLEAMVPDPAAREVAFLNAAIRAIEAEAASPAADGLDNLLAMEQAIERAKVVIVTEAGAPVTARDLATYIYGSRDARLAAPPRPHDEGG